jgi:hypothetical protein
MTLGAHLVAVAGTLVCLLFLGTLLRRGHLRAKYVMIWIPVGFTMLLFSAVPGLLDSVALGIGIGYPPALLFMMAIVLLLLTCMHFSWELSRIEERMRLLAEAIALQQADTNRHARDRDEADDRPHTRASSR